MLHDGKLVIRDYPIEVIAADAMEDLLRLFEGLIRFEDTVAAVEVPKDDLAMAQTMDEIMMTVDRCLIAYIEEESVGMMLIHKGEPYDIGSLFIVEDRRGQGIGQLLIEYLQRDHPTKPLTVNCYKGNTRALQFYHQLGFVFTEHGMVMKGMRSAI